MKKLLFIGIVLFTSCYEYIPPGIVAQEHAEDFLDSISGKSKVENKVGMGFISIKEYLNPIKQRTFQQDTTYHLSKTSGRFLLKK